MESTLDTIFENFDPDSDVSFWVDILEFFRGFKYDNIEGILSEVQRRGLEFVRADWMNSNVIYRKHTNELVPFALVCNRQSCFTLKARHEVFESGFQISEAVRNLWILDRIDSDAIMNDVYENYIEEYPEWFEDDSGNVFQQNEFTRFFQLSNLTFRPCNQIRIWFESNSFYFNGIEIDMTWNNGGIIDVSRRSLVV